MPANLGPFHPPWRSPGCLSVPPCCPRPAPGRHHLPSVPFRLVLCPHEAVRGSPRPAQRFQVRPRCRRQPDVILAAGQGPSCEHHDSPFTPPSVDARVLSPLGCRERPCTAVRASLGSGTRRVGWEGGVARELAVREEPRLCAQRPRRGSDFPPSSPAAVPVPVLVATLASVKRRLAGTCVSPVTDDHTFRVLAGTLLRVAFL